MRLTRLPLAIILAALLSACAASAPPPQEAGPLFGVIGKLKAQAGQRDALANILLGATHDMPGCLSYIIANDPKDSDALWITEVWTSRERHKASLALPQVQQALKAGRPLIAGFGERFETAPLGGAGLPRQR